MRNRSITAIFLSGALVGALGLASLSPALAANHKKMTGACAQSSGRCVSDCDQLNWCQVYTCVNGRSTPAAFWRCFQPSGLCLAPHC